MIVNYDTAEQAANHDFFTWLALMKAIGATEVVIDVRQPKTSKWDLGNVLRRIASILLPGPALAGLPWRLGEDGERHLRHHHMRELVAWAKAGNAVPRFATVLPPRHERYTVTLRKQPRDPLRNSNEAAWRAFADEIGAVVIEDYDVTPIHLHERVALYAGAQMNFGMSSGPLHVATLCGYPVMSFGIQRLHEQRRSWGLAAHEPVPWGRAIDVHEPDDLKVLRRHFNAWRRASA